MPKWLVVTVALIAIICFYTLLPLKDWLGIIADEIVAAGALGVVLYVIGYTLGTALFFPAALLSILAGFAWDKFGGFAIALPAILIAATIELVLSRYLFRSKFQRWLGARPKARAIEHAVEQRGPWLVFLLRFSPVVPFPFVNYALGLTQLPMWQFGLATLFGMMPITFLYTYTGSVGRLLGTDAPMSVEQKVSIGIGLAITAGVTIWVTLVARKALRGAVPAGATT